MQGMQEECKGCKKMKIKRQEDDDSQNSKPVALVEVFESEATALCNLTV